ncbi:MAG: radical SAM protein [Nitrososphaerota archaeon]|nr:radical SAM protein [Nitrososphaerota archaeon]
MRYDLILIHPPSVHDFRRKPFFPGPIAVTVGRYTPIFIAVPLGMISISEYLNRMGYKTKILNLAELMIRNKDLEVEEVLSKFEAEVFGVDLHWCVSSHGSIKIAKICKELHPNSHVVLGGLTATCFHDEIVKEFPFIDAVVRGEAEEVLPKIIETKGEKRYFRNIPNLTYLNEFGQVKVNSFVPLCESLDKYEFSRVDLIEPNELLLSGSGGLKSWVLPLARGCILNCRHCGGSAYSYELLFNRLKPAIRSPQKILEDITTLKELGVEAVFLIQDPRTLGRKYWQSLFNILKIERIDLKQLGIELFWPANEEFLDTASGMGIPLIMNISPESGNDEVRKRQGRYYTTKQLLDTVLKCRSKDIKIAVFFMIGCGFETFETLNETWHLCAKLYHLDRELRKGHEKDYAGPLWIKPEIGVMILLDPGSYAFVNPEECGYQLYFKSFIDYYHGLTYPSWHQWFSYRTIYFSREDLAKLTIRSLDLLINLEEQFNTYRTTAELCQLRFEKFRNSLNYFIMNEIDKIMLIKDEKERNDRLHTLSSVVDEYLKIFPWSIEVPQIKDSYNYSLKIKRIMLDTIGILLD